MLWFRALIEISDWMFGGDGFIEVMLLRPLIFVGLFTRLDYLPFIGVVLTHPCPQQTHVVVKGLWKGIEVVKEVKT